jgi:putative ABC transport system ATP-binding protein
VVLVTHEPRFASWTNRVVFLRDGRIVDQTESTIGDRAPAAAGVR